VEITTAIKYTTNTIFLNQTVKFDSVSVVFISKYMQNPIENTHIEAMMIILTNGCQCLYDIARIQIGIPMKKDIKKVITILFIKRSFHSMSACSGFCLT